MLGAVLVQDSDLDDDGGRPETLRLCFATPKRWLADDQSITVERAPTAFGEVSVKLTSHLAAGEILAEIALPARASPTRTLPGASVGDLIRQSPPLRRSPTPHPPVSGVRVPPEIALRGRPFLARTVFGGDAVHGRLRRDAVTHRPVAPRHHADRNEELAPGVQLRAVVRPIVDELALHPRTTFEIFAHTLG